MTEKAKEVGKKRFVVALPPELPGRRGLGYSDIEKIAGTYAGSPQEAVSKYLHRVASDRAKLITDILNQEMGGAAKYAFEVPYVVELLPDGGEREWTADKRRRMTGYALAYDLATCYSGNPVAFLDRAEKVLESFEAQGTNGGE